EPTAHRVPAIALHVVVFDFARDFEGVSRHRERRYKCATTRPLAIAAMAIASHDRFGGAFIADCSTHTTASKRCRHNTIPPLSVMYCVSAGLTLLDIVYLYALCRGLCQPFI